MLLLLFAGSSAKTPSTSLARKRARIQITKRNPLLEMGVCVFFLLPEHFRFGCEFAFWYLFGIVLLCSGERFFFLPLFFASRRSHFLCVFIWVNCIYITQFKWNVQPLYTWRRRLMCDQTYPGQMRNLRVSLNIVLCNRRSHTACPVVARRNIRQDVLGIQGLDMHIYGNDLATLRSLFYYFRVFFFFVDFENMFRRYFIHG